MEQNVQTWSHTTGKIFNSVLFFSLGSIAASIMAGLSFIWSWGIGSVNVFTVLMWICEIAVIAGYILYIICLGDLRGLVGEKEISAIGQIRTAAIITIVASVFVAFSAPVWIAYIINFAAYVVMLVGFNTLKKSPMMPERAKNGFSQLFISMLLAIIATALFVIFGWIPVVKIVITIITGLMNIAAFVMLITGWDAVKNSAAPID